MRNPRTGQAALAGVINGKWVVKCPFCGQCEKRDHGDWHICRACLNAEADFLRVRVTWPSPSDRVQIERLLANREWSWVRNWTPDEPVEHLAEENLKFGIPVD